MLDLLLKDKRLYSAVQIKQYEKLKLDLWKSYEHDRDGGTNEQIQSSVEMDTEQR